MVFESIQNTISLRRLLLIICVETDLLDINDDKIRIGNDLVNKILSDIETDCKLSQSVEIRIITGNTPIKINKIQKSCYVEKCLGSTNRMLCRANEIRIAYIKQLQNTEIGYYIPTLIFITDEFSKINECYREKEKVLNAVIKVGMRCPKGPMPGDIEIFGVPKLTNVREFDTRKLLQYAFDGYPHSISSADSGFEAVKKHFQMHSCQLRERVDPEFVDSLKFQSIPTLNILNGKEMEDLLADLAEE